MEGKEDVAWVVVDAICRGDDDCSICRITVASESFGDSGVEGSVDCTRGGGLGLPGRFLCIVDDISITGCLCVEANGTVGPGIWGIYPWCGRFEGVFRRLFGNATDWRVSRH